MIQWSRGCLKEKGSQHLQCYSTARLLFAACAITACHWSRPLRVHAWFTTILVQILSRFVIRFYTSSCRDGVAVVVGSEKFWSWPYCREFHQLSMGTIDVVESCIFETGASSLEGVMRHWPQKSQIQKILKNILTKKQNAQVGTRAWSYVKKYFYQIWGGRLCVCVAVCAFGYHVCVCCSIFWGRVFCTQ